MVRSLRILILAPFGVRPKSSLTLRALPLAQALVRRGHQVVIVAPPVHNPEDAGSCVVYDGVPVQHTALTGWPGAAGALAQVAALAHPALSGPFDLLHLFKPKGYSGLAARLARLVRPRLPLVVDTDDWEGWGGWNNLLPYPPPAKHLFAWQERDLPRHADAVTVASRTLETQVWGFGVAPERVIYLPNGIALAAPIERPAAPVAPAPPWQARRWTLLLYTRFWEFAVRDVVAALAGVLSVCPQARLRVVGRGERGEERELLQLAARAGLAHAIEDCGWVEPTQIPLHFAAADLALYPMDDRLINRAKCSVKLLELMAAGLPLVAARVGQVAEYLEHQVSGLLVTPGDPGAMAQAALRLLANPAERAGYGLAARARAAQFAWDALADPAERAYQVALGRRSGRL